MEFDVVLVGDPRFTGGTGTAMASEAKALADAGYAVGFVPVEAALLKRPREMQPDLRRLVTDGSLTLVPQGERVRTRLAILHHPQIFTTYPAVPLLITAEQTVLVTHHPARNGLGKAEYDVAAIVRTVEDLFGPVTWAPVGPKARASFAGVSTPPLLTREDWVNVLDPNRFALERTGFLGAVPVIGRHSRPDQAKWPATRDAFLAAYPDASDIRVRLLGYDSALDTVVGGRPANWEVLPFNALPVRSFLGSIDYFVYFHGPSWVEAFGYSVIEAMASGAVAILPTDFAPLFGEGAICCTEADVLSQVRALHADPRAYQRQSEAGRRLVRERFGPERAVARVADRIGPPATHRPSASPARRPKVLYLTSNGVGMGHLTRALATARRLAPRAEPVVVTMSKGFGVANLDGIEAEYLTYHRAVGMDWREWDRHLDAELVEIIGFHRPDVFVFDGNYPYTGMITALTRFPAMWKVWQRRAMWPPGSGAEYLKKEPAFDLVIEPAELAAPFDRGLTRKQRDRTLLVPPVTYLRDGEALDRDAARADIGLPQDCLAYVLQLGSGNNLDLSEVRALLFDRLRQKASDGQEIRLVVAEWMVSNQETLLPDGVMRLRRFPFSRVLAAFDGAVAMAGYNTFHENIRAALPTLFVANEHPEQDEQWRRAEYGAVRGLCLSARLGHPYSVIEAVDRLRDPQVRQSIRQACAALPVDDGAGRVADYLYQLACQRKTRRETA